MPRLVRRNGFYPDIKDLQIHNGKKYWALRKRHVRMLHLDEECNKILIIFVILCSIILG